MCSMHCNKVTTMHADVYHYKKHTVSSTFVFKHSPWLHWNNQQCTLDLVKLICGWFVNETCLCTTICESSQREKHSEFVCLLTDGSVPKTLSYKPTQTAARSEFFQNKHSPTVSCASIYCMSHVHNVLEEVDLNTEVNLKMNRKSSEVTPSSSRPSSAF